MKRIGSLSILFFSFLTVSAQNQIDVRYNEIENSIQFVLSNVVKKSYSLTKAPYAFSEKNFTDLKIALQADSSLANLAEIRKKWDPLVPPLLKKYWQPLIRIDTATETAVITNIPGIQYSLKESSRQSFTMKLCISNALVEQCVKDDGFSRSISKREFITYYTRLVDSFAHHFGNDELHSIGQQLALYADTLFMTYEKGAKKYDQVLNKININKLAYNDSVSATISMQRTLPYYRLMNGVYKQAGILELQRGSIYINDGFIYNIDFSLSNEKARELNIIPSQSYGTRYNLKNNSFVGYMLSRSSRVENGRLKLETPVIRHTDFIKVNKRMNVLVLARDKRGIEDSTDVKDSGRFVIFPHELIHYKTPTKAPNTTFTAKETRLDFPEPSSFDTVRIINEKSLYSFINLDLFTDLIGLFGEEKPNGLLQTELKINFYGFRSPFSQKYPSRARIVPLDKGELFFRLSKLDNNLRYLDVFTDATTNIRYIHGINLLQYQSVYAGLRGNLLDIEYRGGSSSLQGEVAFIRTPIRDTISETSGSGSVTKIPKEYGINSFSYSIAANFKFKGASFLDIDITPKLIWINPRTTNVKLSGSEYSTLYSNNYTAIPKQRAFIFLLRGMATVNLNDDKTQRLILRGEHYNDIDNHANSFWAMQVGYSADLNKFIKFK